MVTPVMAPDPIRRRAAAARAARPPAPRAAPRASRGPYRGGSGASTVRPPSTGTVAPVTKLAPSPSRSAIVAATSSGAPDAAERVQPAQRGVLRLVVALGPHRAGRDGVHADAVRAVLDRQRAGQPLDRGLGRHVGQAARDRRRAWWEETLTIAPPVPAARKRRTATAQPTSAGSRLLRDQRAHLDRGASCSDASRNTAALLTQPASVPAASRGRPPAPPRPGRRRRRSRRARARRAPRRARRGRARSRRPPRRRRRAAAPPAPGRCRARLR